MSADSAKPRKRRPGSGSRAGRVRQKPKERARAHAALRSQDSDSQQGVSPLRKGERETIRLNRWLSEQGVASRRKADEMIEAGLIEVNGQVVQQLGFRIHPNDEVFVEGVRIKPARRLYYLFNKPKGVLCTESPRENRPRVRDLVDGQVAGHVYTVGRLDEASEGLLLLTNDGDFSNLMAHPRYGVPKTYIVQVAGVPDQESLVRLRKGIHLSEGKTRPMSVRIVRRAPAYTTLRVVLREGMNREIRRMFAKVGLAVKSLKRVQIGDLTLRGVPRGRVRPLSRAERDELVSLAKETTPSKPT